MVRLLLSAGVGLLSALWVVHISSDELCRNVAFASALVIAGYCTDEYAGPAKWEPMRVLGAGLGKTGTNTLQQALDDLGYKTYHFNRVPQHGRLWRDVIDGHKSIDDVIDQVSLEGYNATFDHPLALLWREFLQRYPDVKVILSVRDSAEEWFSSWSKMFVRIHTFRMWPLKLVKEIQTAFDLHEFLMPHGVKSWKKGDCMAEEDMSRKQAQEKFDRQKGLCESGYEEHVRAVEEAVPPAQLLRYNVRMGFNPLCEFLEVPTAACPQELPHLSANWQWALTEYVGYCITNWWVVALLASAACAVRCCASPQ